MCPPYQTNIQRQISIFCYGQEQQEQQEQSCSSSSSRSSGSDGYCSTTEVGDEQPQPEHLELWKKVEENLLKTAWPLASLHW